VKAWGAASSGVHRDAGRRKLLLESWKVSQTDAELGASTLARLMARTADADFKELSATMWEIGMISSMTS